MEDKSTAEIETHIKELPLGVVGVVVGYDRPYAGYTGKLNMMGLAPGAKFVVLKTNSQEGAIEVMLENRIVKLSKPEANALCVEKVTESE